MWRYLILLAACGGTSARPGPVATESVGACRAQPPVGDPSQSTLRDVPGFTIAPPQTCAAGSYIRIERTAGTRRLGTARVNGGGFSEGCMDLADTAACKDVINVGALVEQATKELEPEHLEVAGLGAGPCAPDLTGDYAGWNFATGVHDWKNADRLIAKITELMDRYDVRGYVGASVYAIPCASLD